MDTALTMEMVLEKFHSALYWVSIAEFSLLCVLFLFFLRAPGHMWFFLLNVCHIPRGFLGLQIEKRVPQSYEIVETMRPRTDEEAALQMNFNQFEYRMQTAVVNLVKQVYSRVQLKLRAYFILTILCAIFDLIAFLVQLIRFAE